MLKVVFAALDRWCLAENANRVEMGALRLRPFEVKVLGQTALIEQHVKLPLVATHDVDAYANFDYTAMREFERLLLRRHRVFDRHSQEIWMPKETRYNVLFRGKIVTGKVARPEYVLLSKAIKAPRKNAELMRAYLRGKPSRVFVKLAETYNLDLRRFQ